MVGAQGVLPGCERLFAPDPMPRGTERVLEVIAGYCRGSWGECRAFYRTLARVLHRSVRWVAERIAWARRQPGLLQIVHRGPKASILRVAEHFAELLRAHLITELKRSKTSTEKSPILSTVVEASATESEGEKTHEKPSLPNGEHGQRAAAGNGSGVPTSQAAEGEKPPLGAPGSTPEPPRRDPVSLKQQRRTAPPLIPLGYCEQFRAYIGVFIAAGLPLCTMDLHRAHAAWTGTPPDQWVLATQDALRMCQTRQTRFIQYPVNHLQMQPWTRVAMERMLPEPEKPRSAWRKAWDAATGRAG